MSFMKEIPHLKVSVFSLILICHNRQRPLNTYLHSCNIFNRKSISFFRTFYYDDSYMQQKRPSSAVRGQSSYPDYHSSSRLQPRPPEKPRAQSAKTRVKSSTSKLADKRQSATLSAKLAASGKQVANIMGRLAEGGLQKHQWQHSPVPTWDFAAKEGRDGRVSPASTRYTPVNVFVCSSCDKMYNTQKDLDIHKSFCYGRVNENYT